MIIIKEKIDLETEKNDIIKIKVKVKNEKKVQSK